MRLWLISALILLVSVTAFQNSHGFRQRLPLHLRAKEKATNREEKTGAQGPPSKLTLGAVIQLITMGAGAPSLGEYKETDENGRMIFELEANNFLGELKGKNFQDGWVETSDDAIERPPGFFQNLLSGGKLMEEWDKKNRKN